MHYQGEIGTLLREGSWKEGCLLGLVFVQLNEGMTINLLFFMYVYCICMSTEQWPRRNLYGNSKVCLFRMHLCFVA